METKLKKAIEEYQCSGCISGHNTECFESCETGKGCGKHYAGTFMIPAGKMFLGMPKGFNRLGSSEDMKPFIFENLKEDWGEYNKFNIPVWKHLDKHGNTIVRGLQPRLNAPFIHIILGDHRDMIDCLEITENDIKEMD
jgi:hypothetical protein